MIDLFNEIMATMKCNKSRTLLTGFAVSWGIFILIVLLSMAQGVVNEMTHQMNRRNQAVIELYGGWAQKPYKGLKTGRIIYLIDGDQACIDAQHPAQVKETSAIKRNSKPQVKTSKDYISGGYTGVYPSYMRIQGLEMMSGRFINNLDMTEKRRSVVIPEKYLTTLFEPNVNPIGQIITINDLSFSVVGVYTNPWDTRIYIPFTTAQALAGDNRYCYEMMVSLKDSTTAEQGEQLESGLRQTMSRLRDFDASDTSALYFWNSLSYYAKKLSAKSGLMMAVWILGILTLLSGIVGVSNIMFVSVRERTHEIGIRRAIGAKPRSILTQVILESVAITTLFGYIGIVMGTLAAKLIGSIVSESDDTILLNPTISLSIAIQVTIVLIVAGALAGLFPALKALKVKPVEALRDE